MVEDNEEHRPGSLVPFSEKINQIKARNSVNMTGKKHMCKNDWPFTCSVHDK